MEKIKKFLKSIPAEIKRVIWPTPGKTLKNSLAATGIMVIAGVLLYGMDTVAHLLINGILKLV